MIAGFTFGENTPLVKEVLYFSYHAEMSGVWGQMTTATKNVPNYLGRKTSKVAAPILGKMKLFKCMKSKLPP